MTLLVMGATGTLGQAVMAAAQNRGMDAVGAARSGADHVVDVIDGAALAALVSAVQPEIVVNCAALTDLNQCEQDPAANWLVNARAAGLLAAAAPDARLLHVSTDHFFTGAGNHPHDETAPVTLVNEYARAKFAAESLVSTHRDALAVRTNVVGWRGWDGRPAFVEWASVTLRRGETISGFDDFFTSSIDAPALSEALLDLAAMPVRGLLNVASREVASKLQFIRALADAMDMDGADIQAGSVRALPVARAESAGLDVTRAETLLGRHLPTLQDVVEALVAQEPQSCRS